jgi:hypothetical protein
VAPAPSFSGPSSSLLCYALLHPSWIKPARVQVNIRAHRFRPFAGDFASPVVGSLARSVDPPVAVLLGLALQDGRVVVAPDTASLCRHARMQIKTKVETSSPTRVRRSMRGAETSTATKRARRPVVRWAGGPHHGFFCGSRLLPRRRSEGGREGRRNEVCLGHYLLVYNC